MLIKYDLLKPDLLLIDILMPVLNGTEAVIKLKKTYPNAKVLFLSMLVGDEYVYQTIKAGGNGLVNKSLSKGELIYAIRTIHKGNNYFGPLYDELKIKEVVAKYDFTYHQMNLINHAELTKTENKIVMLVAAGYTSTEIAVEMAISKRTVDHHRSIIMHKLGLSTLPAFIKYAISYSEGQETRV